jgi:hypothetical protein
MPASNFAQDSCRMLCWALVDGLLCRTEVEFGWAGHISECARISVPTVIASQSVDPRFFDIIFVSLNFLAVCFDQVK